jgi:hypothetical protein
MRIAGAANCSIEPAEALVNAAKFAAPRFLTTVPRNETGHLLNHLISKDYLSTRVFRY